MTWVIVGAIWGWSFGQIISGRTEFGEWLWFLPSRLPNKRHGGGDGP